jgi:hypothetical protein
MVAPLDVINKII